MKLGIEDVQCIRAMAGSSAEIALQFGVSRSTIKGIRNGRGRSSIPNYVRPQMSLHVRGTEVRGSKLRESDVLEIRKSTMSNVELAVQWGVTRQLVWQIRKGSVWAWLSDERFQSPAIPACFGRGPDIKSPAEREALFWTKVNKTETCWLWTAGKTSDGYGSFKIGKRSVRSHRFSFELVNGPIPKGMLICHRCDVPSCIRPEHLFIGSNAENHQDRNKKGRQARGSKSGRAILTEADVLLIRGSTETQKVLAVRYGVDPSTIGYARRGKNWSHLLDTKHMSPAIPACLSLESTLDDFHEFRKRVDSDTAAALLMLVDAIKGREEPLLTPKEAANALNVSTKLVQELAAGGHVRSIKVGKPIRIKREWLTDYTTPRKSRSRHW